MKRFQKFFSVLAVSFLVLYGSVVYAADGVNWEEGTIVATGMGIAPPDTVNIAQAKALARRAAVVDAYRQMAETISGVQVTSESTVKMFMTQSDVTRTKVEATIKGAKIVKERMTPAGAYEVTMVVPMFGVTGSLAGAIMESPKEKETFPEPVRSVPPTPVTSLPTSVSASVTVNIPATPATPTTPITPTIPTIPTTPIKPDSEPTYVPPTDSNTSGSSAAPAPEGKAIGGYTGLIVDCRGLGLETAMSPVIKNDSGSPIYGYKNLDIDKIISNGMASYSKDVNNCQRAGSHPLIVRAVGLDGHNINPVLSTADANRVLIENGATGFLDKTNVVFLR